MITHWRPFSIMLWSEHYAKNSGSLYTKLNLFPKWIFIPFNETAYFIKLRGLFFILQRKTVIKETWYMYNNKHYKCSKLQSDSLNSNRKDMLIFIYTITMIKLEQMQFMEVPHASYVHQLQEDAVFWIAVTIFPFPWI